MSVRVVVAVRLADCCVVVARWLACLSMGLPRRSWWVPMHARWLIPDVVVAISSHVAARAGNRGAACCGGPRHGSTD